MLMSRNHVTCHDGKVDKYWPRYGESKITCFHEFQSMHCWTKTILRPPITRTHLVPCRRFTYQSLSKGHGWDLWRNGRRWGTNIDMVSQRLQVFMNFEASIAIIASTVQSTHMALMQSIQTLLPCSLLRRLWCCFCGSSGAPVQKRSSCM